MAANELSPEMIAALSEYADDGYYDPGPLPDPEDGEDKPSRFQISLHINKWILHCATQAAFDGITRSELITATNSADGITNGRVTMLHKANLLQTDGSKRVAGMHPKGEKVYWVPAHMYKTPVPFKSRTTTCPCCGHTWAYSAAGADFSGEDQE